MSTEPAEPPEVCVVGNDPSWRLQRALGLLPPDGVAIVRRTLVLIAITWLPMAVWALVEDRFSGTPPDAKFLTHFGMHARFLVAVPLMLATEGRVHSIMPRVMPYFLSTGILAQEDAGRYQQVARAMLRLRDHTLPWIGVVAIAISFAIFSPLPEADHEVLWATEDGVLGFGGIWFVYVAKPIFLAVLLAWLWRLVLVGLLLYRIARLPLKLVPSHPDRSGGLGFLDLLPTMFMPLVFALSALIASHWCHHILYHGETLETLRPLMIAFVVLVLVLFLGPFLVFTPMLVRRKWKAQLEYGALVSRHRHMVHERWILDQPVEDAKGMLGAPELGPSVDVDSIYQAVDRMRPVPIRRRGLFAVLVPAGIPLLLVISVRIPISEILTSLVKALV